MFAEESMFGQRVVQVDDKSRIILPAFTYAKKDDEVLVLKSEDELKIVRPDDIEQYIAILEEKLKSSSDPETISLIEENIKNIAFTVFRKERIDSQRRICLGELVEKNQMYRVIGARKSIYIRKELTR